MALGAGWFWSALLDSPALAASFGIGLALGVPLLFETCYGLFRLANYAVLRWWDVPMTPPLSVSGQQTWIIALCLLAGPLCFVAGTRYYLRRVEP